MSWARSTQLGGSVVVATLVALLGGHGCGNPVVESKSLCEQASGELYERRIAPLLAEDQPKSCNQCHLSGVDLGMFVKGTPCEAMACLVDEGLVDLDSPEQSAVLGFIERAEPDSDLITSRVIAEEYQGFLQWIEHEAECQQCAGASCPEADEPVCAIAGEPLEAFDPERDSGECDDRTLEQLFLATVYRSRGRCSPCHANHVKPDDFPLDSPTWLLQEGSCEQASLATLREIERRRYIDVDEPERSLLLLKPLAEEDGGVEHGGADKFHSEEDPSYQNFLYFIERYAGCKGADH